MKALLRSLALLVALVVSISFLGCDHLPQPSPACGVTISPANQTFPSEGGSATVTVSTSVSSCAWTAAATAPWITILEGATGAGSGSVKYTVAVNASADARAGALSIGDKIHGIGQQGQTPVSCNYAVAPASASIGSGGGAGSIAVTAPATCPWTVASNAAWVTITSGRQGVGNGTVAYAVERNSDAAARNAALAIADQTFAVAQAGAQCSYAIAPASTTVSAEGGTGTLTVTTQSACPWTATSDATWVVVTSGGQGVGNGTVAYSIGRNPGAAPRSATVVVGDQTLAVTQSGSLAACEYSVAPLQLDVCMPSGVLSTKITTDASCPWTAASNAPWLVVSSAGSGSGTTNISLSFSANYDAPREGVVMVRWPTPTAGQNVRVLQAGCRYGVSKTAIGIGAGGGSDTFDVLQQSDPTECGGATQDRCIWTATSDVPWITITTSMPRAGDNPVSFTVAPNDGAAVRTGTIKVRDQVVHITQAGR